MHLNPETFSNFANLWGEFAELWNKFDPKEKFYVEGLMVVGAICFVAAVTALVTAPPENK